MNHQRGNEKFEYMTKTPVAPLIGKLAVPTIISMLVNTFYNLVDSYFVGKLSTSMAGAVGVVYPLTMIMQAIAFLFGHGSGNFVSRKLGEKETEKATKMVSCGFYYSFVVGILIMAVGLCVPGPLTDLLGATVTIRPYAVSYLIYILIGAPFFMSSLVINNQLRFQGNAMYAMIGMVTGAVVNMVLDPVLIFSCNMGVSGAALATMISQIVSFVILLIGTTRGGSIRISFKNFSFDFYYVKEIFRGGVPSLFRQGLGSLASICLNQAAGPIGGDAAITGMSIVSRIMMFTGSALIGFGQGFQPVCAFNYGAGFYKRVKESFVFCVKIATVVMLVLSSLGWIFAPELVAIFKKEDPEVIEIATNALRYQCVTFPFSGWIVMVNMMLQSVGKAVPASITAACRQGLFFIPMVLILPGLWGMNGVYFAQPLADFFTLLLSVPFGLHFLKQLDARTS